MTNDQTQKSARQKPEDAAGNMHIIERETAMLNLIEFIRTNKIGINWTSSNSWQLNYKGKRLGYLHKSGDTWRFSHNRLYIDKYFEMEDGDLKIFIFDNIYVRTCGNCQQWNPNAQKVGYMNPTDCGCYPLRIFNPDGEMLELTKRLIEYRKNCILEDSI